MCIHQSVKDIILECYYYINIKSNYTASSHLDQARIHNLNRLMQSDIDCGKRVIGFLLKKHVTLLTSRYIYIDLTYSSFLYA
jgi:hypothetical protein